VKFRLLIVLAILLVAAIAGLVWHSRPLPVLTVTTWAGPYGRAQASAMMRPYAAAKSVDVRIVQWDGEFADLKKGDVVDMELPQAVEACQRGLLEKIDAAPLPAGSDGKSAKSDFLPGAVGPCWVGSLVYSQLILFRADARKAPTGPADFFDLKKFPGGRGLRQGPKFNLELALIADGVLARDVYKTLATDDGVARAFARLDAIKRRIAWWSAAGEPMQMLMDGRVVMSTALNGDLYNPKRKIQPGVLRDYQLYEMDVFGIPKTSTRKDATMDFIAYATASEPLANAASWVPYSPARRSALPRVGKNPDTGEAMQAFMPLRPQDMDTAFAVDDFWWRAHGAQINVRWQAWLERK
jgi:putative spermidine/putrescine transport system substrate-binding protein